MLCEGCGNPVIDGTCACPTGADAKELKDKLALAREIILWHENRESYCYEMCPFDIPPEDEAKMSVTDLLVAINKKKYPIKHTEMCAKIQNFLGE